MIRNAMKASIAAGHAETAKAGAQVLRRGGNAVDAIIASTLSAFIAEPGLTSPFGGGFALVAGPGIEPVAFDFFADVPGREQSLALAGATDFFSVRVSFGVTDQVFHIGRGSLAVSSVLEGLAELGRQFGSLPLTGLANRAVEMAEQGIVLSSATAEILRILEPILMHRSEGRRVFAPRGEMLTAGERLLNPDAAQLLRDFSHGGSALPSDQFLRAFSPPNGLVTPADLHAYQAISRRPLSVTVEDFEILLTPPPTSGGVLIALGLRLLERVDNSIWRDETRSTEHFAAALAWLDEVRRQSVDPILEAADAGAIDEILSDPRFVDRRWPRFCELLINPPQPPTAPPRSLGSTTHISVIDSQGMACALTSSNGEGCGYVVPATGIIGNNFLGEADLHPRGFHQAPAGQRITSMMCPTIVLKHGLPTLALGSGGSNRIRSALLHVLVEYVFRGRGLDDAVGSPRMHFEAGGLALEAHQRSPGTMATLAQRYPDAVVFSEPNLFFGGVNVAARGRLGAGDPRRQGCALVVDPSAPGDTP